MINNIGNNYNAGIYGGGHPPAQVAHDHPFHGAQHQPNNQNLPRTPDPVLPPRREPTPDPVLPPPM